MRLRTAHMAAIALLTAGLTLTACGNDSGGSGKVSTDTPSNTATGTGTGTGTSSPGVNGGRSMAPSGGSVGGDTNAGTGSGTGAGGDHCLTSQLGFAVAPGSGARSKGSQGAVTITLTNKGAKACVMKGYPGVDLVGGSTKWSLTRYTAESPSTVTVRPGATTTFNIFYLPFSKGAGQEFQPKSIVVTPPNETHAHTLPWDFSSVLLQDGATHPGTYVSPVGSK
ncbi:DUF4232 domain-containing protein [Streptomyces sp. SDr-06]|uniref:DUF4232 domain-containing protein n=1 Tax=Streptomyces sp. SDr-06 TaxID=2267702 RepID=UPI000E1212D7|nr:DUF4232 domain-containing protein [Streptomyces sp. SDr-06]RCH66069.1 DUF4232 domain-containing protein [Streptomyces sp. SDr-06]